MFGIIALDNNFLMSDAVIKHVEYSFNVVMAFNEVVFTCFAVASFSDFLFAIVSNLKF